MKQPLYQQLFPSRGLFQTVEKRGLVADTTETRGEGKHGLQQHYSELEKREEGKKDAGQTQ